MSSEDRASTIRDIDTQINYFEDQLRKLKDAKEVLLNLKSSRIPPERRLKRLIQESDRFNGMKQYKAIQTIMEEAAEPMHPRKVAKKLILNGYRRPNGKRPSIGKLQGSVNTVFSKSKELYRSIGGGLWEMIPKNDQEPPITMQEPSNNANGQP